MSYTEQDRPAAQGELTHLEITPQMIEAGRKELIDSEALEFSSFATPQLIRRILSAALSARR